MAVTGLVAAAFAGPLARLLADGAGLGIAAGLCYAAGDVGTKAVVGGPARILVSLPVLAAHGLGFVCLQLGFQRGGAIATAGVATLFTNAVPIAAGMAVYGDGLPSGPLGVARLTALRAQAILVAPQGAGDDNTDTEYLDWGPGRNWEQAVSKELPAYVDSHYRTIPKRPARALVGLSAGGYGAVSLAFHHLDDFGVVESWSGYFHPTNPQGTAASTSLALEHLTPVSGSDPPGPSGFVQVRKGPAGGVVLRGRIPNSVVPGDRRDSAIYLPPGYQAGTRYPAIFLLHGFPGSPSGYYDSLQLATVADGLISSHRVAPFVAVMPVAGGVSGKRSDEEWAGRWETYLVRDVVPWGATHLSLESGPSGRAIAGLSAGAYGAVDIALRHPGLFGVAESWSGYFRPFRDGPLAHANGAELAAHDPTLLVRREAARLRSGHVRFFLSTGFNHGGIFRSWTFEFAHELQALGIQHRVWASQRPDGGRYLRLQLPAALEYAFGQSY